MKIKPILAVLTAPLVLLPAIAAAPTAEAAPPISIKKASPLIQIQSVEYPDSPAYPTDSKGTLAITTHTTGHVKSVCVAWEFAAGEPWNPAQETRYPEFSEPYLQKATKQATGVWTFDLPYDLQGKYNAIRFSVAADNDNNCADTVTPSQRLDDKTADVKMDQIVNFHPTVSLSLKASRTLVPKGSTVTFTATMLAEPYPAIAGPDEGQLERKIGSGPWEEISDNTYFFCPAYGDCDLELQGVDSDKTKTRVLQTAQYRAVVYITCVTAIGDETIAVYSDPVTITVQ